MLPGASNVILRSLSQDILASFAPQLDEVSLTQNEVLHEAGGKISHVYFPLTGLISVLTVVENADPVENCLIGHEGAAGTVVLANPRAFARVEVRLAGRAIRIRTETFFKLYGLSPEFRSSILEFNVSILAQIQQNVACNILHDTKHRVCRWLLYATDRMASRQLLVTQETLALSLSAHRATIISAFASLESEGVIRHGRGKIEVLDRQRLLSCSCECYVQVQRRNRDVREREMT